jgi:PST family polysaccharide transporter
MPADPIAPGTDEPTGTRVDDAAVLGGRPLRSGALMLVSHGVQLAVGVGAVMILARLLTPRDFGLLAMASLLLDLVRSLRDFGLPMAVVHEAELDRAQLSRLFWVNLRIGAVVTLAAFLLAPVAAWFFGEPVLVGIVIAIASGAFVQGLANLHLGLLRREFRFRAITVMEIASLLAGAAVGVGAALLGAGYWALVAQQVVQLLSQAVLLFALGGFRPQRGVGSDAASVRSMLRYGRQTTYARVFGFLGREIDRALVGRFTDAAALGLYASAQRWSNFPVRQIYLPLLGVAVATLSRLQRDPPRYRAFAGAAFTGVFAAALPALAFLCVRAEDVILFLLGDQWLGAVPLFRILAVGAFFGSSTRLTKWVYLSKGRTRHQFQWTLVSTPVMVGGAAIGIPWGATGIALGYAGATILLAGPAMLFALAPSPLGRSALLAAAWRPACASVLAAAVLETLPGEALWPRVLSLRLLAQAMAFGSLYLGAWAMLPGGITRLRRIRALLAEAQASPR